MPSLFQKSLSGVKVKHCKNTAELPAVRMPVPDKVVIPMLQHMGAPCDLKVKVGDTVTVGQVIGDSDAFLSAVIHSSVSGTVTAITEFVAFAGEKCLAAVIETDKKQTPCPSLKPPVIESHQDLVKAARDCGLVGLGGAGFPTHIKMNPKNLDEIDTVVINGAECEPYITCDTRTMLDKSEDLLEGIAVIKKFLGVGRVIIGIEANKPQCIEHLTKATADMEGVSVSTLRAQYPQGAEKVIIFETIGRTVMEGQLPADQGVIVFNVATVAKLAEFLRTGMPLVEKMLTVDGSAIAEPKNIIVPIGTQISDMIDFCGGYKAEAKKIIMGGPMMGIVVVSDEFPMLKNNNAILAFDAEESRQVFETNCIRCGRCTAACPFDLMPLELDKAYHNEDVEGLKKYKVNLCMECGCCSYVCPASRYLVMSNRLGKKLLKEKGI